MEDEYDPANVETDEYNPAVIMSNVTDPEENAREQTIEDALKLLVESGFDMSNLQQEEPDDVKHSDQDLEEDEEEEAEDEADNVDEYNQYAQKRIACNKIEMLERLHPEVHADTTSKINDPWMFLPHHTWGTDMKFMEFPHGVSRSKRGEVMSQDETKESVLMLQQHAYLPLRSAKRKTYEELAHISKQHHAKRFQQAEFAKKRKSAVPRVLHSSGSEEKFHFIKPVKTTKTQVRELLTPYKSKSRSSNKPKPYNDDDDDDDDDDEEEEDEEECGGPCATIEEDEDEEKEEGEEEEEDEEEEEVEEDDNEEEDEDDEDDEFQSDFGDDDGLEEIIGDPIEEDVSMVCRDDYTIIEGD
jgi:hypothetical protein